MSIEILPFKFGIVIGGSFQLFYEQCKIDLGRIYG